MQSPKIVLTILGKMAQKPEVKFDNLFPKLYNPKLWLLAYEKIAPKPGNLTPGVDGKTNDGFSLHLVNHLIGELKASRYKPSPVRRVYLPKPNGTGQRPIGIPSFQDKLLQTVLKLILESIYEPLFSNVSHGFRPKRSCHTALAEVKKMKGIRWWIEGDITGFFNNLDLEVLLNILQKRISDQRFLHLIKQFCTAGYLENWQFHQTYSGVPQGGNLSPVIANIYLNEFDQAMRDKTAEFNKGLQRADSTEYRQFQAQVWQARKKAIISGDWTTYKTLSKELRKLPSRDSFDPNFRRLHFTRYADDWLVGVIGSKAEAVALKDWIKKYLKERLALELNEAKTRVTNSKDRVNFLGYEIKRWHSVRHLRIHTRRGVVRTQRTTNYHLMLLIPRQKLIKFGQKYGNTANWWGKRRAYLQNLSELEILMTYNAEVRGFLNYYSLADNLTSQASRLLRLSSTSFFHTLAAKRRTTMTKVATQLKQGPGRYVIALHKGGQRIKEYELLVSTRQLQKGQVSHTPELDKLPNLYQYRSRTELGQRLLAQKCEWCGYSQGEIQIEVHHIRKLKDLKGKTDWEQVMLARQRKTMVLCHECHVALHAGRLSEKNRVKT